VRFGEKLPSFLGVTWGLAFGEHLSLWRFVEAALNMNPLCSFNTAVSEK
jgi:hypothetical protein